jgi:hypothetical protein
MSTLSRSEIRSVSCPKCGALPDKPCFHTGKGAGKRNRLGQNHHERMQRAQAEILQNWCRADLIE